MTIQLPGGFKARLEIKQKQNIKNITK